MASLSINSLLRTLRMKQTKKRSQCVLLEKELNLPGWTAKELHDLFEAIQIHGMKRLKKLHRHVSSKSLEDVRIATELYKKEVRIRELTFGLEQQIEEAGVTNEDYKTWLYFAMGSQPQASQQQLPIVALDSFLQQVCPRIQQNTELSFANWRRAEIRDFLATFELSDVVKNVAAHIPTKTKLEIHGATDAYNIICDVRNLAIERGHQIPTYDDLRPGYIYLQCVVAVLSNCDKMINFTQNISSNEDPDMAKATHVLKEWLMPDVGTLHKGWTKDEKYLLIVAVETHGAFDLNMMQSLFPFKTKSDLMSAIDALKYEAQLKENSYIKSTGQKYASLTSWSRTFSRCKGRQQIAAGKRLISALEELPVTLCPQTFLKVLQTDVTMNEWTMALLNIAMEATFKGGATLIPALKKYVKKLQNELTDPSAELCTATLSPFPDSDSESDIEPNTESDSPPYSESDTELDSEPEAEPDTAPETVPQPRTKPKPSSMSKTTSKSKKKRWPKRK